MCARACMRVRENAKGFANDKGSRYIEENECGFSITIQTTYTETHTHTHDI